MSIILIEMADTIPIGQFHIMF